jgi:hypothetical protein
VKPIQLAARPTQVVAKRSENVPDLGGLDARTAIARAIAQGFEVSASGSGIVAMQQPAAGAVTVSRRIELTLRPRREHLR